MIRYYETIVIAIVNCDCSIGIELKLNMIRYYESIVIVIVRYELTKIKIK